MTKTTAKKGMLSFKSGYGRDEFDYDYIAEIAYNEKILVKHLVQKLNDADDDNKKLIVALGNEVESLQAKNEALSKDLNALKETVNQMLSVNLGG